MQTNDHFEKQLIEGGNATKALDLEFRREVERREAAEDQLLLEEATAMQLRRRSNRVNRNQRMLKRSMATTEAKNQQPEQIDGAASSPGNNAETSNAASRTGTANINHFQRLIDESIPKTKFEGTI